MPQGIARNPRMPQGIEHRCVSFLCPRAKSIVGAFLFSNTGAKNKTHYYITYEYYTSYLYYTYYTNYINYSAGSCRAQNESVMLLVWVLASPLRWMCRLASFLQWICTQMLFPIYEIISIIVNNSAIMRIILMKRQWIGPIWHEGELSSWSDDMIHLIESLYVGLQCVGRCYKLLNPGITIEIIEIIQDIMRIILFFSWICGLGFIMRACLVIPKLCWRSWTLISHRSAYRTRIGVTRSWK